MRRVAVVGAGIGGLAAAVDLARRGCEVTVIDRAEAAGGKIRQLRCAGAPVDAGPTVLTMRWIFEELFAEAGDSLDARLHLAPAGILARHAWGPGEGERLDLHADLERTVAAIGAFAGAAEAAGYRAFCARAADIFATLDAPFIRRQRPRLDQLVAAVGRTGLGGLARLGRISPFDTLHKALGEHFRDARLRQLFGRYATYCGSSPFLAPATLMLVAHVERAGVWLPTGGMRALAQAVADLAGRQGAAFRFNTAVRRVERAGDGAVSGVVLDDGERLPADAVVVNADVAALAAGLLGADLARGVPATAQRSLSAVTFAMRATAGGFPLVRHNVFFSRDYPAEFDSIFKHGRPPDEPTTYVCAQDRGDDDAPRAEPERLLCLVNAPADGRALTEGEMARCELAMRRVLNRCGLTLEPLATVRTDPGGFETLFPATGGALYGPASHGWQASFQRAGARTRVPGLYLAGGSVHPGPGVPMAAMSGRLAAAAILDDGAASTGRVSMTAALMGKGSTAKASTAKASTAEASTTGASPFRSPRTATPGGTSTP